MICKVSWRHFWWHKQQWNLCKWAVAVWHNKYSDYNSCVQIQLDTVSWWYGVWILLQTNSTMTRDVISENRFQSSNDKCRQSPWYSFQPSTSDNNTKNIVFMQTSNWLFSSKHLQALYLLWKQWQQNKSLNLIKTNICAKNMQFWPDLKQIQTFSP